jgi:hypothetical protein
MKSYITILVVILFVSCFGVSEGADPFPPESLPSVFIGSSLPIWYEPSGIVWHLQLQKLLLVSDSGAVSLMDAGGTGLSHWYPGGDIEGITIADPQSDFIYLGNENPDSISEFNVNTATVTRTFNLTSWMIGASNAGLEALTFVHDSNDLEGGLFYAGLQATGEIFVFRLPILSSTTSTSVTHIQTIPAISGISDISGMHYESSQGVLYAIYDSSNLLRAMTPDGTLLKEWILPGHDQEGITLGGIELYTCQDTGEAYSYSPFKVYPQPDLNADGEINLWDFAVLAAYWNSGTVFDMSDLMIIAYYWLEYFP